MILEEFDPDRTAIVEPPKGFLPDGPFPDTAVSCFTQGMLHTLLVEICGGDGRPATYTSGIGSPVYFSIYKGKKLAVFRSPVGAPACAAVLEDIYAMGIGKVVLFGTCGVLDRNIPDGSVIIPDSAIRDEGTSYHYAPPSDEIVLTQKYRDRFISLLEQGGIPHTSGKVWTTDAIYRETRAKAARRRQQGCICVDMECSALAAVSQFREKELFQFFYAADNLDADTWEPRSLSSQRKKSRKKKIAQLALELAADISLYEE